MKTNSRLAPPVAVIVVALATVATCATVAASAAATPSFKSDLLNEMKGVSEQVIELAQAVPAEKYTWRPAEGVRSIAEAYLHIAASNYEILGFTAHPAAGAPADPAKFETSTSDKAQVVAALARSFQATREAIEKIPDAAMDQPFKAGSKRTLRSILLEIPGHVHEHLGQEIAYARMNGVVPPWTARRQQAQPPPKSGR
jgi:uncharacterized damage-inducible protein DinB